MWFLRSAKQVVLINICIYFINSYIACSKDLNKFTKVEIRSLIFNVGFAIVTILFSSGHKYRKKHSTPSPEQRAQ